MIPWIDSSCTNETQSYFEFFGHTFMLHLKQYPDYWSWAIFSKSHPEMKRIAAGSFEPSLTKKQAQESLLQITIDKLLTETNNFVQRIQGS